MNGKRNRTAGHNFEAWLAKVFRWIGFQHVITTRSGSRLRDSQKIDLMNSDESLCGRLPYNVQAKNVIDRVKYDKLLEELPRINGIINVVVHNRTEKLGTRFVTKGQYAILTLDDFLLLVQQRDERRIAKSLASLPKGRIEQGILPEAKGKNHRGV
jgi:hypothetical protein